MKSHQLTTTVLLLLLMQIDKRREISSCGQLQPTLVPSITNTDPIHRWPWHAAIYHKINESHSTYVCGGTVISSQSILTAGHCVSLNDIQLDATLVTVSLGRLYLDVSESSAPFIKVSKIFRHPNFVSENLKNDIAIIKLSTIVIFNSYVQPICLWKENKTDLSEVIGKNGTFVGWGLTENGIPSNVLRQASLPVVSLTTCLKSNRDLFGLLLSRTNYCAGIRNDTSVCTGDGDGSMTFEEKGIYYIRGVVSLIPAHLNLVNQEVVCDSTEYAIFTDVAKYLQWISDTGKNL